MDQRAICRIVVVDGAWESRGTGFLIAPNLVLTAAHVVRTAGDPAQPHAGTVEVKFLDVNRKLVGAADATVQRFDRTRDWALLACPSAPAIDPMPVRALARGYRVGWQSLGFPAGAENQGLDVSGVTVAFGARIQLLVDQATGSAAGLSGAPYVVSGAAAALIVASRDPTSAETLFAVDLRTIADACPELRARLQSEPPYVPHVSSQLKGPLELLPAAARRLGLADLEATVAPAERPREVARAMMSAGTTGTVTALAELVSGLPERAAADIVDLASEIWIDRAAVETMRAAMDAGAIVLLNADLPRVGEGYLHRAGCLRNENPPGQFRLWSALLSEEQSPDVLLARFEAAVAAGLAVGLDELDDEMTRNDHDNFPVVVVFPPPAPARAAIDALRAARGGLFQPVRLVLLVGDDLPAAVRADFPDAVVVEPRLGDGQEERDRDDRIRARKDLARHYKAAAR